ncbi:cysteine desulfurase family protein [Nitriliruptor alkaliphilus]|uniref:cysteine desulfurase family protein n=1 Tax=Nitriliruptor alkaliphilus TaxID=427918 RepID=UPI000698AA1E|nr:aminotransferase class V-fold PLP-dependent enzyme [Nitriliruptor alkaliphilus]
MSERRYLDHAAAWPLRPEAATAWRDAAAVATGDPARAHAEGRAAAELLARATEATAAGVGVRDDALTWTSGGTEAVHLAVLGTARADALAGGTRRHLVVSAVEHSAVLAAVDRLRVDHGFEVDVVGVDGSGTVDPDAVAAALRDDTLAVHLQHANHEVGTIQPVVEVARACAHVGALLHVDACQSVGQVGLAVSDLGADLLTASAAKFGGPRAVGFLAQGPRGRVVAVQEGDDRQGRRRSGQLDVPSVAAAAVALQVALRDLQTERSARELVRRHLRTRLPEVVADVEVHGPLADAHPGIVAASALYVDGEALVRELDRAGFAVHSGSSCATTSGEPSHVLVAMGALTHGHLRVSVGPDTTVADADRFLEAYASVVTDLRGRVGR